MVGTSVCFISGGEPFLRANLLDLMAKHAELLFVVFTNGSQITKSIAEKLRDCKNIIPALSIDGTEKTVAERRGEMAWKNIQNAANYFKNAGLLFGFSTMVTKETLTEICDLNFFKNRIEEGYQLDL